MSQELALPDATATDKTLELRTQIIHNLHCAVNSKPDTASQIELANLIDMLHRIDIIDIEDSRQAMKYELLVSLDLAVSFLVANKNNVLLAQNIRRNMQDQMGLFKYTGFMRHHSPPTYVLLGLFAQVTLITFLIAVFANYITLYQVQAPGLLMLLMVAIVGAAGRIISIMVRIAEFAGLLSVRPPILFFTGLFKPIIGMAFALFIYTAIQAKIIPFSLAETGASESFVWASVAFLAGFSERFVPDVVRKLEDIFSGKTDTSSPTK